MDSDVPSSSPVPSEERPHDSTYIKVYVFLDTIFHTSKQQLGTTAQTQTVRQPFQLLPAITA